MVAERKNGSVPLRDVSGIDDLVKAWRDSRPQIMHWVIFLREGTVQDGEDALQDGFLDAAEKIDTYNPDLERAPGNWLRVIIKNRRRTVEMRQNQGNIDSLDARQDLANTLASQEPLPEDMVVNGVYSEQARRVIWGCVAGLSPEQQIVIKMRYKNGMTDEEIAASLGLPPGTIKSRLRLALQHLRESGEIERLRI